jgi:hypothetical protein
LEGGPFNAVTAIGIADAQKIGMRAKLDLRGERGLGMVGVLAVIFVLGLLALFVFAPMVACGGSRNKAKATRIKCVNNLKNVGLAFRLSSTDSSDRFPQQRMMINGVAMAEIDVVRIFGALSNEIGDPKILICPTDKSRSAAASTTNLTTRNISYFASLSAEVTLPQAFLAGDRNMATNGVEAGTGLYALTTNSAVSWTKEMHDEHGDIAMGDGSVQQMSSSRLKQSLRDQDLGTNYLVFP